VGSHITYYYYYYYYYNKIAVVKNIFILEIKSLLGLKIPSVSHKNGQNNKVLKFMAYDMRKIQGRRFPMPFIRGWTSKYRICMCVCVYIYIYIYTRVYIPWV